jgi:hypothetical protein
MKHPMIHSLKYKESLIVSNANIHSGIENDQSFEFQKKLLFNIIETQSNSAHYFSYGFTAHHKTMCYRAFHNLLQQYPKDMVGYLLGNLRSGGFQHKIFQEYIRLLESSLPFTLQRNRELYQVKSLLDPYLGLFDGISIFESNVSNNGIIKNGTTENYVGGRKSSIIRPYYIGKLLNIIDIDTKESLLSKVKEYTFSIIKTDILPNTRVSISHLRIPPHYQMGGMTYVNRVRAKIVKQAKSNDQGG